MGGWDGMSWIKYLKGCSRTKIEMKIDVFFLHRCMQECSVALICVYAKKYLWAWVTDTVLYACVCVCTRSRYSKACESIAENFYKQKHWIYDFKHVRNDCSCNAVHQVQCLGMTIHAFPKLFSFRIFFLVIQNQQKHLQYIFTSTNR